MSDEENVKKDNANELAHIICFVFYLTVPIALAYLITKFGVAPIFKIEGWERSLPLYLYGFFIIFELLLGYFIEKHKVDEKISNFLMKHFKRWL